MASVLLLLDCGIVSQLLKHISWRLYDQKGLVNKTKGPLAHFCDNCASHHALRTRRFRSGWVTTTVIKNIDSNLVPVRARSRESRFHYTANKVFLWFCYFQIYSDSWRQYAVREVNSQFSQRQGSKQKTVSFGVSH